MPDGIAGIHGNRGNVVSVSCRLQRVRWVRIHPTQLYEVAALMPITWLPLRWRREHRPDRFVLGAYFVATGSVRFVIEFLRMRESLFGPFAVAHVFSFAAVSVGVALLYSSQRSPGVSHA